MRSLTQPSQRINLYRGRQGRGAETHLQLSVFGWVAAIGLVLIGVAFGYLQLRSDELRAERDNFASQLHGYQQQLEKLQGQKPATGPDQRLLNEILRLQASEKQLAEAIRLIEGQQKVAASGFGPVFRGLARHPVEGLWLDEIQASADGGHFVLRGLALQPVLIPRLLKALGNEPVFEGRTFGQVNVQRAETAAGPLRFELRTRPRDADGD
jgi:hypothetical protein